MTGFYTEFAAYYLFIKAVVAVDDDVVDCGLRSFEHTQFEGYGFGWGQTGLIGKLALKFTNFSIKNLFRPGTYKGLIPQGEGQTFTISAQTRQDR